jgi:hypothetical protein
MTASAGSCPSSATETVSRPRVRLVVQHEKRTALPLNRNRRFDEARVDALIELEDHMP